MRFHVVEIGLKWYCPFCGTRKLLEHVAPKVAKCLKCGHLFQVMVPALPDPNSRTGRDHCGKKIQHPTIQSAFNHASELKELPHKVRKQLCIYKCAFGEHYHVGHKGKVRRLETSYWMFLDLAQEYSALLNPQQA